MKHQCRGKITSLAWPTLKIGAMVCEPGGARYRYGSMVEAANANPTVSAETLKYLPWLVAVALFMENLDATIVNTAVPTMAANLHVARSV